MFALTDISESHWLAGTTNFAFDVQLEDGQTGHVVVSRTPPPQREEVLAKLNAMVADVGAEAIERDLLAPAGLVL